MREKPTAKHERCWSPYRLVITFHSPAAYMLYHHEVDHARSTQTSSDEVPGDGDFVAVAVADDDVGLSQLNWLVEVDNNLNVGHADAH